MVPEHPLSHVCARWAAFADGLGLSEESLRHRLAGEYSMTLLPVIDATRKNLPDPLLTERLTSIADRMTAVPDEVNGSIAASVAAMSDDEVRNIANELLELGHVIGADAMRVYDAD